MGSNRTFMELKCGSVGPLLRMSVLIVPLWN